MGRSTILAATALMMGASPAAADESPGAMLPGAAAAANVSPFPLTQRAGKPRYDQGGWLCPPGLVWRNAGRTDWLCVDPMEARRIREENLQAPGNWIQEPDGSRSCRSGLVTREAFKRDVVCVDPVRRESVQRMNSALFSLR